MNNMTSNLIQLIDNNPLLAHQLKPNTVLLLIGVIYILNRTTTVLVFSCVLTVYIKYKLEYHTEKSGYMGNQRTSCPNTHANTYFYF